MVPKKSNVFTKSCKQCAMLRGARRLEGYGGHPFTPKVYNLNVLGYQDNTACSGQVSRVSEQSDAGF